MHYELIFICCEIRVQFHYSTWGYVAFPAPFAKEARNHRVLGTFAGDQLTINADRTSHCFIMGIDFQFFNMKRVLETGCITM